MLNHYLADRATHSFPQSRLFLPVLRDGRRTLPLDRRRGTVLIADRQGLENVSARYDRVWRIVVPAANSKLNVPDVNAYVRRSWVTPRGGCWRLPAEVVLRRGRDKSRIGRVMNADASASQLSDVLSASGDRNETMYCR